MSESKHPPDSQNGDERWWDAYRMAVDDCRFNIRLGWDRTQYFLALNVALFAAGVGIVKVGEPDSWTLLAALLFVIGFFIALLGANSVARAHKYYRRSRDHVLALEARMGWREGAAGAAPWYDPRATRTTDTMISPDQDVQPGKVRIWSVRSGTVVFNTILMLLLLAALNLGSVVIVVLHASNQRPTTRPSNQINCHQPAMCRSPTVDPVRRPKPSQLPFWQCP